MRKVAEKLVKQINNEPSDYDSIEILEEFFKKTAEEVGWDQKALEDKLKKILENGKR